MAIELLSLLPDPPLPTDAEDVFDAKAGATLTAQQKMVNVDINGKLVPQINAATAQITEDKNATAQFAQYANEAAETANAAKVAAQQAVVDAGVAGAEQVQLANDARLASEDARDSSEAFLAAVGSAAGAPSIVGKAGKSLVVNPSGSGVLWGDPYPAYPGKARMSLQVLPDEQGVRWVDVGDRIGDTLTTSRNPGSLYLPTDGAVYLKSAYTELFQTLGLLGGTKANSWSAVTSGFGTADIKGIATNDNGIWIFLSTTGVIRRSTDDGLTLAAVSGITVQAAIDVVYCGNGVFVAFGAGLTIVYKSVDNGLTWTLIPKASIWASDFSISAGASDGEGGVILAGHANGNAYSAWSTDYGVSWVVQMVVSGMATSNVALGKDGKAFLVGYYGSPAQYQVYSSTLKSLWTQKVGVTGSGGTGLQISVSTDGQGVWIISLANFAYRIGANGDGTPVTLANPISGKVATDKNGTWLVGNYVSTNNGIDFVTANLAAPVASSVTASRAGTFMVGATAGSLRRSVPVFPYDSATQFALPNITSPIGVKTYIKAKEAA